MNIPIVVVAYNRKNSLFRLLNSLNEGYFESNDVELIISIDCGDNQDVYNIANDFIWKHGIKKVIYHNEKLGLQKHVLKCGDLVKKYEAIIMLEDDLYVSKFFYLYALQAYQFVIDKKQVGGVSLYNHKMHNELFLPFSPIEDGYDNWYFQFASSWGQMWTKEQWVNFRKWLDYNWNYDFFNNLRIPNHIKKWGNNSWLKYNIAYLIETNKYFLYPRISLTTNFSEIGTNHKVSDTNYQVELFCGDNKNYKWCFSKIENSSAVYDAFYENDRIKYDGKHVEVDLYGVKPVPVSESLFLTCCVIDGAKCIKTYGRILRPHDMNVLNVYPGSDFRLYEIKGNEIKHSFTNNNKIQRNKYYIKELSYNNLKILVLLFFKETITKIRNKVRIRKYK